jgi:hypothetical protein
MLRADKGGGGSRSGGGAGGGAEESDAVAKFLETGTWVGLLEAGEASCARGGGEQQQGQAASGAWRWGGGVGGVQQPDVTPVFKNRAYVLRRERMRPQYESARSGVSIRAFVLVKHVNCVVKPSDTRALAQS